MPGDAWESNNHLRPSCASVSPAMVSSGGGAEMYSSVCFQPFSNRLWNLANIWTYQLPLSGGFKEEENPRVEGSAQFSCIHCAAPFPTRDLLDKHELLHSPNAQVTCKVCNKPFANVYRLQRHMISHDESAILRKFKCPECDKAFKFKHHLKEHIRIHSGEKPFECGNCGKRFSHSGSYSSHMTSKKCLIMNLKVSQRQASPRGGAVDSKSQSYRQPSMKQQRSVVNNNNFPPILPKYNETAPFLSGFAPSVAGGMPFYFDPNIIPAAPYIQSSLSHLLEQIHPPREVKNEVEEENKPSTSPVETELEDEAKRSSPVAAPSGDLEAVKRILETVSATVTKQFLADNVKKLSANSCSSGCPSVASGAPSPQAVDESDSMNCRYCNKSFISRIDLHQHERYLCSDEKSEGLAAKLEDVVSLKQEDTNGNICSGSEDETRASTVLTDEEADVDQDGRKVRVRSQIAEEQLQILKSHYSLNPRPKREDLARIADQVGFPVRVVQVWFQNNRARDRREGRLVHVPYIPAVYQPPYPNSPPYSEQPLDLSTKKLQSFSPCSSPIRSDSEDGGAVNLSRRAPPPPSSHDSSRLARILTQSYGVSPYYSSHSSPPQNGHLSPSRKRPWKQDDYEFVEGANYDTPAGHLSYDSSEPAYGAHSNDANDNALPKRIRTDSSEPYGQFNCDLCDKSFAKLSSFARHKYEHSGQRPHKCDTCTKAFKHKHHLTEHKRLHSGEKPFQCAKCLKRFSHSGSYSQHMNHRYSYCKPYRE